MTKKLTYLLLFLLMSFGINMTCNAQTVNDLEKKINKLQSDIKVSQNLLKQTSQDKKVTMQQIEICQAQIEQRNALIKAYNGQISELNNSINADKKELKDLEAKLQKSRESYAKILVVYNRNRNKLNNLLFVFSSKDFNQAVRRARYLNQFNELLKQKMVEIKEIKEDIKANIEKTEANKKRIDNLLAVQKTEKIEIEKDKKKLNGDIAKYNKQEKDIKKKIAQKQKEADDLQKKIKEIIAKEVELRKKANAEVDTKLSENFASNKGKLPWPVASGVVTGKYGKSTHPTQSKVTLDNHGIDISTNSGAEALCVFNGQIVNVFTVGTTNVVFVRHGLYFTLYSNLDKIYVKAGDNVSTGQKLGVIHTDVNDNATVLHFEIWNERNHINPVGWLK